MPEPIATPSVSSPDSELARMAVAEGVRRYFAERRNRIGPFVDRHFSLRGALQLHRVALGWDILKAPLNLSLAGPQVAMRLASIVAGRLGARGPARRLRRSILLETAVAREVTWLIHTELLELPFRQGRRVATHDALAASILQTPQVEAAIAGAFAESDDPAFALRLRQAVAEYTVSRAAAAEITTGLLSLGAGAVALNKLTPGAASLGPTLAAIISQQTAVAAFPLGGWLGGLWYGLFPARPSVGLISFTTGGLMLAATTFAAFAGIVADPIQRALGLHRARLRRMVAALERQFFEPLAPGFMVRDHYVARLLDLFDLIGAAVRLSRP